MKNTTYKNSFGQTVELFETAKGYVVHNTETGTVSVYYKGTEDSGHLAATVESALKFIQ